MDWILQLLVSISIWLLFKESILENAFYTSNGIAYFAYLVGILTALLTFLFMEIIIPNISWWHRSNNKTYDHAHESPLVMTVPLFILAIGSIFSGIFFADYFIGYYKKVRDNAILLTESSLNIFLLRNH